MAGIQIPLINDENMNFSDMFEMVNYAKSKVNNQTPSNDYGYEGVVEVPVEEPDVDKAINDWKRDEENGLHTLKDQGYKVSKWDETETLSRKNTDGSGDLNFYMPSYGVEDFIIDRANWQKQLGGITGEPGWFYFKIFFNFNTNYGLLGGILSDTKNSSNNETNNQLGTPISINTAIRYLYNIRKLYAQEQISHRMLALYKFVGILSYISCEAPWFFKGVGGLNNIHGAYTTEFEKNKSISIQCSEEAVDMRLGTLLDLYKFACFDNINCKEIIPANLRKFDMNILFFHIPIKYHQTSVNDFTFKKIPSAGTYNSSKFSDSISFKLYTFQNCEIDPTSLNSWMSDSVTNETAFTLGKNSIKINYDRVYEHRMNEWLQMMFGSDGFHYNVNNPASYFVGGIQSEGDYIINKPSQNLFEQRENLLSNASKSNLQLTEYSENLIRDFFTEIEKYGKDFKPGKLQQENINSTSSTYFRDKMIDMKDNLSKFNMGNLYGTFTNIRSQYYRNKMEYFKDGTIEGGNLYDFDFIRTGTDPNRKNTKYLQEKLDRLKNGEANQFNIPQELAAKSNFKLSWGSQAAKNSYNTYNTAGLYDENKSFFGNLVSSVWGQTKAAFGFK